MGAGSESESERECEGCAAPPPRHPAFISQKVFIELFRIGKFPHKSVKSSFIITNVKHKLTDLCGN